MKPWPEVVSAVIAGKGDATILEEAAYLSVRRLAGWQAPRLADVTFAAASPDARESISPAAAQRLSEMLAGTYREFLPEWLALAVASGRRVPAQFLPELLQYARQEPSVRDAVDSVAGTRGRWLAALNPDWAFGALEDADAAFATGARPARVAALRTLRARDPAAARELLTSSWKNESGDDRAALLPALGEGLTSADEPFLEEVLKDRKRDVRKAAAELLARLPASGFVTRMRQRVATLITLKKSLLGARLDVSPPQACDAGMLADAIDPKPPPGTGEKAWWLNQMIAYVPVSTWAIEMVTLAPSSDWSRALLDGWCAASVRERDAAWAEALLSQWVELKPAERLGLLDFVGALIVALPTDRRDALILAALRRNLESGAELLSRSKQWTAEMSRAFVAILGQLARSTHSAFEVFTQARMHCDPAVYGQLVAMTSRWPSEHINQLFDLVVPALQYRAAMRKELSP